MKKRIALLVLALVCLIGLFAITATADEAPKASIAGHNLSLNDNIYIIYYASFQNVSDDVEKGVLVWTSQRESYEYGTQYAILPVYTGNNYGYDAYYFTGVSAKMMTQDIYAKAYVKIGDEITYGELDKYSVLQYCYNKTGSTTKLNGSTITLGELIQDILQYGASAQKYFNFNPDRLATADYYEIKVAGGTLPDATKSGLYPAGAQATLTATIENFDHWENTAGATVGTTKTLVVPVGGAETYTAKAESQDALEPDFENCNHVEKVIDAAIAATCTTTGLTEGWHCPVCGEKVAQTVTPATGHTPVVDPAIPATCTEAGLTEGKHCSVCGTVLVSQVVIPAAHTPVIDPAVEATTESTGLTAGSHCSVCGMTLVPQTVVPQLEAKYTITYNNLLTFADGTRNPNPKEYTANDEITLKDISFGYLNFKYWTDENGEIVNKIEKGTTGNKTLTAHWVSRENYATQASANNPIDVIFDEDGGRYYFFQELGTIRNIVLAREIAKEKQSFSVPVDLGISKTTKYEESTATTAATVISNATSDTHNWGSNDSHQSTHNISVGAEFPIDVINVKLGYSYTDETGHTSFSNYGTSSSSSQTDSISATVAYKKDAEQTFESTEKVSVDEPIGGYSYVNVCSATVYVAVIYDFESKEFTYSTFGTLNDGIKSMFLYELPENSNLVIDETDPLDYVISDKMNETIENTLSEEIKYTIVNDSRVVCMVSDWTTDLYAVANNAEVKNGTTIIDFDTDKIYTVYKNETNLPESVEANAIFDFSGIGSGTLTTEEIHLCAKEYYIIGKLGRTYTIDSFVLEGDSPKTIHLKDVNLKATSDYGAFSNQKDNEYGLVSGGTVIFDVQGTCSITSTNSDAPAAIWLPLQNVEITGSGTLTIKGATGAEGFFKIAFEERNGGAGIVAWNLAVDLDGTLNAEGGRGGHGSEDNYATSGGNGGNAVTCEYLYVSERSTIRFTGGKGGDGGDGKDECINPYSEGHNSIDRFGGVGGDGGNGGHALQSDKFTILTQNVTMIGGAGGRGGQGGDGNRGISNAKYMYINPGGDGGNGGNGGNGIVPGVHGNGGIEGCYGEIGDFSGTVHVNGTSGVHGADGKDGAVIDLADSVNPTEPVVLQSLYKRVNEENEEDPNGGYVLFGSYPQSEVTNGALIEILNAKAGALPTAENAGNWTSYRYDDGYHPADYMWYQDLSFDGETYRGVYFTSYRPVCINNPTEATNSNQDDNGYNAGNAYWFQFEPLKWRILSEENGNAILLCESIIDSQHFFKMQVVSGQECGPQKIQGDIVDMNSYRYSDIRAWLNTTFYETAFTGLQQVLIKTTTVDNSAKTTNPNGQPKYWNNGTNQYADSTSTQDKVFLLSVEEATNSAYDFSGVTSAQDDIRRKELTDYAKAQGAQSYSDYGLWWLRSPHYNAKTVSHDVNKKGIVEEDTSDETDIGVAPALQIRFAAETPLQEESSYAHPAEQDAISAMAQSGNRVYLSIIALPD